ncbi:hypothetical protein [Lutibacter sp.]|uniref:hypothetical protein n=1 Tax=Lutibacter sp. TaxID=1925666 RepID=UPI00349FD6CB
MLKNLIISSNSLFIQIIEDSESKLLFNSVEYVFLFICIIIALLIMILIPAILCYFMIDNFFNIYKHKKEIDTSICTGDFSHNSEYTKYTCDKYLKSCSNFVKNLTGLAAWNIFSLAYIIIGFESFKTGLIEYFRFPFNVFNSLNTDAISNSIKGFSSNWSSMFTIIVLTFIFTLLGKYIGNTMGKERIKQRGLV